MGTKEITSALLRAQQKFSPIEKNTSAFKYKYAPLDVCFDAIKPALAEEGILVHQPSTVREDGVTVQSTVLTHVESGEWISSELPMSMDGGPQDHGSASTYYKRYTFLGVCGAQPVDEDDDGRVAQESRPSGKASSGGGGKPNGATRNAVSQKSGVAVAYSQFLRSAKTYPELADWWEKNKGELDKLKGSNNVAWQEVVAEFSKRKKQIEKEG